MCQRTQNIILQQPYYITYDIPCKEVVLILQKLSIFQVLPLLLKK